MRQRLRVLWASPLFDFLRSQGFYWVGGWVYLWEGIIRLTSLGYYRPYYTAVYTFKLVERQERELAKKKRQIAHVFYAPVEAMPQEQRGAIRADG